MTRRYTGAEARELAAKASPGPWTSRVRDGVRYVDAPRDGGGASIVCELFSRGADASLAAAAPDLAESLAAVEAERDALRAAARELLGAYGDFSVEYPPTIDEAARFHAALAALREAAK